MTISCHPRGCFSFIESLHFVRALPTVVFFFTHLLLLFTLRLPYSLRSFQMPIYVPSLSTLSHLFMHRTHHASKVCFCSLLRKLRLFVVFVCLCLLSQPTSAVAKQSRPQMPCVTRVSIFPDHSITNISKYHLLLPLTTERKTLYLLRR